MAAVAASLLSAELERYLTYVREDLHNHLLASIRGSALNARLRQLVNGAMGRIKQGLMQIRLLVPIRALLRDISSYTTILRNSNIIRLFVGRERVSQALRAFQLRISNLAARLQIYVKPFLSIDDIRVTSQDNHFFDRSLTKYRSSPDAMLSLVRTIRHEELKDLHSLLSNNLYTRPNRLVGAAAVDFALKARRAIEQVLGHREGLHVSPSLAASHAMPNISDIRRDIGHLPPLPADLSGRLPPVPLSQPSSTPATQPAFQPLRSPLLGDLLGTSAPQPLGARSAPLFPHTSPPGSLPGSQMPSFHLEDASSSDPVLFEDSRITTVFEEASPFPSPGSFSVDPFRASTSAAPASAPQPVQSYPAGSQSTNPTSLPPPASPLLSPTAVPRFLPIRYYDANLGKFLEWRAFQGWLWQAPHTIDSAMDYHGESVQPQSVVTVVAQFAGLDDIQRQAILDHVSLPSRAPALLRQAVVGDKLRVLQLFSIRGTTWLACVPFEGGKPGFIPFATYRFLDSRREWRVAKCAGVIQPYRISYHELKPTSLPNALQTPIKWLHFPYSQVLGLNRLSSQTQLQLLLLDRGATREIYIYFASALEALQFYQDVEHMRRVTRQILELQERRRREAEHRSHVTNPAAGSSNMASAQQGTDATPGASHHDVFSPSSNPAETAHGLTPHLGALDGFLNDGSLSPHLSQLGSPRLDPFS